MTLNESLLTPRELELLKNAEELLSKEDGIMLTGSLALAIQGIKKPREANDIDLCNVDCDIYDLRQSGLSLVKSMNPYSEENFFMEYSYKGCKVNYLEALRIKSYSKQCTIVIHNDKEFRIVNAKTILDYKLEHAFCSIGNSEKRRNDLVYILANNSFS